MNHAAARVFVAVLGGRALVAAAVLLGTHTPSAVAATTITATSTADTYVASDTPGTNFATSRQLWVDASPARRMFLKFTVSGITETVTSAKLRLHVANVTAAESSRGGTYRLTSNRTWAESSLTWNSQPAIDGTALGSIGAVARNTWVELDVTGKVTGNGTYSIGVTTTSTDGVAFDSRETGTLAPQLLVPTGTSAGDPVLVGAGDIASSGSGDSATAALLDVIPGTVFTAGDNAYNDGSAAQFTTHYEPTWGRHKARTRPSPGNHDYYTSGATGYFGYFGSLAGPAGRGYYSYDLGNWHVVSLNSEIDMTAGSAQESWLRSDLAASNKPCTFAYWHKPLFTSGANHGPATATRPLFQALYDYNAEVVVAGHNHQYERFAPQAPAGTLDNVRGIRAFVAGTGGNGLYAFGTIRPNSQARNADTLGVLKFTLHSNSYDWQFVPVAGRTYTDSGTTACH